ncbi:prephenate dehydratase [Acidiphilium sp.]|uniref:prephenate dehydratase n=1 Tax=Acidiphilium sp. TaxID=527 RepID=UPI003CFF8BC7
MTDIIAFQGIPGAYSDLACRTAFPGMATLPCQTFEAAIDAVRSGEATLGMLPTENSLSGRVPDMHTLLPESGLSIIGEHFQRVEHCLLAVPGTTLEQVRTIHSHAVALGQIRALIRELGAQGVIEADTAGSAALVARWNDPSRAAVASSLAAEIYELEILRHNVEDAAHNTTRFYVMAKTPRLPPVDADNLITSFVFRVRNVPAALFKALGGFATNGVNMTRLESYMVGGQFAATQFLCEIDGHPERRDVRLALEELAFFSREIRILGVYPAAPFRLAQRAAQISAE